MQSNPESESEPEDLLEKAEAELNRQLDAGELDIEEFSFAYQRMEETTPVSGGEISKQNNFMLKRRDSFRRVAEMLGVGFSKLPFVQKVVLFGSVAAPLKKEVPRFHRMRRARVEIYHECNDVDIAVWVSDLTQMKALKRALSEVTNYYNQVVCHELQVAGVAHHQVDIAIFEPGTDRYRGHLCIYGQCPKGKPECEVPGCGAQKFLQIYKNFQLHPRIFSEQPCVVLYQAQGGEPHPSQTPAPAP